MEDKKMYTVHNPGDPFITLEQLEALREMNEKTAVIPVMHTPVFDCPKMSDEDLALLAEMGKCGAMAGAELRHIVTDSKQDLIDFYMAAIDRNISIHAGGMLAGRANLAAALQAEYEELTKQPIIIKAPPPDLAECAIHKIRESRAERRERERKNKKRNGGK